MNRVIRVLVAVAAVCGLAVGGVVATDGEAKAAPRYTQYFPTVSSGVVRYGDAGNLKPRRWEGFLLNRAQTRDFWNMGLASSLVNRNGVDAVRYAVTPGRGAGCVIVFSTAPSFLEHYDYVEVTYIRTERFARETPDTPRALYWSTKNFRCV